MYHYLLLSVWHGPVEAARIKELVLNGTLSPADYVKDAEDPNAKPVILHEHPSDDLNGINAEWMKLRAVVRVLDRLWIAQRDALMAQITDTTPEDALKEIRKGKGEHSTRFGSLWFITIILAGALGVSLALNLIGFLNW